MRESNQTGLRLLWEPWGDGVRLLRVFGLQDRLVVPDAIEDMPVCCIGAYCFAEAERLPADAQIHGTYVGADEETKHLYPIAGNDLVQIILPDSVAAIEELAFYNCRKLRIIQIGKQTGEIGSDVFMNCRQLTNIQIRGEICGQTGAKAILSRIPWEIQVDFLEGKPASLLYPEYTESYDEIAPAHIFGRNITGEGFRARQLFQDGKVQLSAYDAMFPKITAEEIPLTVGKIALLRLRNPVGLSRDAKERYEKKLREVSAEIGVYYSKKRELPVLEYLCRERYLSGMALEQVIAAARFVNWSEGTASLMDYKSRYAGNRRDKRYSFD